MLLVVGALMAVPAVRAEAPRRLTLPEAIRIAWEQGPDLEEQRRAVAEAELQARQAGAPYLPQAGLGAGYSVSEDAGEGTVTVRLSLDQSFALKPLLGGALPANVRQAQLALEQARRRLEEGRQDVAGSVLGAYLDLVGARSAVEGQRITVEQAETLLAQTEDRARQQAATEADLYDARASALSARQKLAEAEFNALKAQTQLNQLLGLPLRTPLEVSEVHDMTSIEPITPGEAGSAPRAAGNQGQPPGDAPAAAPSVDALIAHALSHRLELAEAREDLAEARTALGELKRPFEPTLSLTATYAGEDGSVQATLPTDTWQVEVSGQARLYTSDENPGSLQLGLGTGWSAGAELSLPLLDGGGRRTARETQAIQVERLEAKVQDLEASVAEEVRQAHEAYLLAQEAVPVRELQLEAARMRLEAEQKRFAAGAITPRDLADAQDDYDAALADHASARLQVLRSAADLQRAAALPVARPDGGWISLEEAAPPEEDAN
ncbi:TolC family protein [Limnochorda pilosa]|uniref:TolC family protein n=1 Tax=Limnochorda pilosa TaxID=1555112 RepID=UPI00118771BD|nr:TolC family protein [Limnochorda pilosa]